MSQAAATADSYGQSSEAVEVALLRLAEQGETGSAAATALSAAMKNLYAPTAQAKALLDELGVNAFDQATGKAKDFNQVVDELNAALNQVYAGDENSDKRIAAAQEIFGIQGFEAYNKMVASSGETVQKFYDGVADSAGSAAQQAETMLDNLAGDITKLGSAYEGFQIAISKNLDTPLREIVQKANAYMSDLTEILKARGLDGLAEALGDKIADALDFLSGYIPGLTETGSKLILSLLNGLVKNLPSAAGTLASTGKILISGFVKNLPDMAVTGMTVIQQLASGVEDNLPELISTGEELLTKFSESMQKKDLRFRRLGKSILKSLTNAISQNLPDLTEAVLNLINFLIEAFSGNLSGMVDAAVTILLALADGLINSIPVLIEKAPEIISHLEQAIKDNSDLIKDSAGTILEKLGESLKNAKDKLKEKAPEIMQNVADALKNAPLSMASVAASIIDAIADALGVKEKWETLKSQISEKLEGFNFETIKMNLDIAFEDIPDDVKTNFENVTQTLSEAGDRLKTSFDNLKDSFDDLKEKFQPLLNTLKEYFTSGEAGEDASDALGTAITIVAGAIAVAANSVSRLISGMMDFGTWLNEGSAGAEALKMTIVGLFGVFSGVSAVTGLVSGFGLLISALTSLPALFTGIGTGAAALFSILANNPVLVVVGLISALIAELVYLYNTNEDVRKTFDYLAEGLALWWQEIKDGWNDFWTTWKAGWKTLDEFGEKIQKMLDYLAEGLALWWQEIKDGWNDFWTTWKAGWKTLDEFGEKIGNFVEGAWQWGKDLIDSFIGGVKEKWNDWEGTWEGVGEVIYDLLHHTHPDKGLLADDYTWMPDMMQSFSEGIRQNIPMVTAQAETLTENLHDILNDPVSVDVDFGKPEIFDLPESDTPKPIIDIPDIPEPENPKLILEIPDIPKLDNPELSLKMPSIDIPELAFSTPELPAFQLPKISPEALEAFRIQSMRMPESFARNAASQIINHNTQYYQTPNQQSVRNQNQPIELTLYSTIEIDGQTFGSAVKQVTIDENMMNGGGYT